MSADRIYIGVIEKGHTGFGIVFPDLPGCVSAGDTIEHVLTMGQEALQFHIDGLVEDGDSVPSSTEITIDAVRHEFPEGEWVALAPITIRIPDLPDTIPVPVKSEIVREIAEIA